MDISDHDRKFCDICANRYPCHYCGNKNIKEYLTGKTLFDAIHDNSRVIMAAFLGSEGGLDIKEITKQHISDMGVTAFEPINEVRKNDCVFGIPDKKVEDIFPIEINLVMSTAAKWTGRGISKIFVGYL